MDGHNDRLNERLNNKSVDAVRRTKHNYVSWCCKNTHTRTHSERTSSSLSSAGGFAPVHDGILEVMSHSKSACTRLGIHIQIEESVCISVKRGILVCGSRHVQTCWSHTCSSATSLAIYSLYTLYIYCLHHLC